MSQVHHLELDVLNHRSVLMQVIGVCHQRGCEVVFLHYDQSQIGGRIALTVQGDASRAERLGVWLSRLVHVLDVTAAAGCER